MTITNVTTLTMRSFTSVSLSGIQTQEPLYTLIHGSSYSQLSNSYLTLVPDSFELWSVTKVSNNWATLFRTKLVWSQNWFKIGSFETENDDGQCVNSQDNLNSEENILFVWFSRFTSTLLSNEISIFCSSFSVLKSIYCGFEFKNCICWLKIIEV